MRTAKVIFSLLCVLSLVACGAKENTREEEAEQIVHEQTNNAVENAESYLIDTDRSTCFSGVGYDPYLDDLYVKFRESGKIYVYENVPQDVYDSLISADSMGGYYNKEIKGYYYCNGPL